MSFRRLLVVALVVGLPRISGAQFTTFIPPRQTAADSVKAIVVAYQKARTDSIIHTQVTNMRTWVDSAAGIIPVGTTRADSLARSVMRPAVETTTTTKTTIIKKTTTPPSATTTTFRNGSRAPATAGALPLVALIGAAALLLGVFLLSSGARTSDGEPVRVRARKPRA